MIELEIEEGGLRRQRFVRTPITMGRDAANDLVLGGAGVSKHHARLLQRDGSYVIEDLGSTNGVRVGGSRIERERALAVGEWIELGGSRARLIAGGEAGGGAERGEGEAALRKSIGEALIASLDLRRFEIDRLAPEALQQHVQSALEPLLDRAREEGRIGSQEARLRIEREILNEVLGLGPLEALLADATVSEVMVNGASQIYVERQGRLALSDATFTSDQAVLSVIERIVAPLGRRIDESMPLVDARLKDGSRVNAIIPPLALNGPCITIRKFERETLGIADLVRFGTISAPMAEFLEVCVRGRKNVVISGGTGSGKTTTLNILSSFIPEDERIVTIEDAAELKLSQRHWIQLEARPSNAEGKGEIGIRELVRNCLRMRPDRIVVGECRSGEAFDMLQAMNTGHDGSLTTLHANSPRDALSRLETMVMMAGLELPFRAIREQIASAIDVIVQQTRFADGSRKITHISEVTGVEGETITMQELFRFEQTGGGMGQKLEGRYVGLGVVPTFYEEFARAGIPCDVAPFAAPGEG